MAIRWDSLLVRQLARSLDRRLSGAQLRALRLDGERRDLVLLFREAALVWRLHPTRSTVLLREAVEPAEGDLRLRARLRRVDAPPDERIVRFELVARGKGADAVEIMVELMGNQLNAVVTEGTDRVMRHVLVRRDGPRTIAVGHRWSPPDPTGRAGVSGDLDLDGWRSLLEEIPPPQRRRTLVRSVAWSSPINADSLLEPTLEAGHARWKEWVDHEGEGDPCVVKSDRGPQPYPFPLLGLQAAPAADLLAALEAATVEAGDGALPEPALSVPPALLARLDDAIHHDERRLVGLQRELDDREDPEALRSVGDLILARFSELPPGSDRATLTGFDGEPVAVELDPQLRPDENAAAYYDRAARSERAAERIPGVMARVEKRLDRLRKLREAAVEGEADVEEIRSVVPAKRRSGGGRDTEP
ncbi:MAG: NFACT family protein, partial [Longimicrobiales bacterium]|nr:NFACT family protein [Longimicrobiales bacterium]